MTEMKKFFIFVSLIMAILPALAELSFGSLKKGDVQTKKVSIYESRVFGKDHELNLPLPSGVWVVRHLDDIKSTHSTPIFGKVLVLDRVEKNNLYATIWLRVYPNSNANWNVLYECAGNVLRTDRSTLLDNYCHSLRVSNFLSNRSSDYQSAVRKDLLDNNVNWSPRVLNFSGFVEKRGGLTLYYEIALNAQVFSGDKNLALEEFNINLEEIIHKSSARKIVDFYTAYSNETYSTILGKALDKSDLLETNANADFIELWRNLFSSEISNAQTSNQLSSTPMASQKPSANTSKENLSIDLQKSLHDKERTQAETLLQISKLKAEAEAAKFRQQELEQQLAQSSANKTTINYGRTLNAHALVIGNSAYAGGARLANPQNDAKSVSKKLRDLGFKVTEVVDADRSKLVTSLSNFSVAAQSADLTMLFYAEHGVQISGTNYMLPVDLNMNDLSQVPLQGVSLSSVVEQYLPGKTKLVFLDACRDNPLMQTASRSISRGLAPINVSEGTLIAYSTKDGQVAQDGDGKNSPFTKALLDHLDDPEDIAVVLRKVREQVMKNTGGKQQPWEYGSLTGGSLVLSAIKQR